MLIRSKITINEAIPLRIALMIKTHSIINLTLCSDYD
nr:MAG TPA: hypothetical protein [Caudoviricetes sp.]